MLTLTHDGRITSPKPSLGRLVGEHPGADYQWHLLDSMDLFRSLCGIDIREPGRLNDWEVPWVSPPNPSFCDACIRVVAPDWQRTIPVEED